jgi:hypothetical protein
MTEKFLVIKNLHKNQKSILLNALIFNLTFYMICMIYKYNKDYILSACGCAKIVDLIVNLPILMVGQKQRTLFQHLVIKLLFRLFLSITRVGGLKESTKGTCKESLSQEVVSPLLNLLYICRWLNPLITLTEDTGHKNTAITILQRQWILLKQRVYKIH